MLELEGVTSERRNTELGGRASMQLLEFLATLKPQPSTMTSRTTMNAQKEAATELLYTFYSIHSYAAPLPYNA